MSWMLPGSLRFQFNDDYSLKSLEGEGWVVASLPSPTISLSCPLMVRLRPDIVDQDSSTSSSPTTTSITIPARCWCEDKVVEVETAEVLACAVTLLSISLPVRPVSSPPGWPGKSVPTPAVAVAPLDPSKAVLAVSRL